MKKLLLCWIGLAQPVFAQIECSEKIIGVIPHANGGIYFQTDKTCSDSWCQIKWSGDSEKNRAFAVLLAARATQTPVRFVWPTINSCEAKNVVYQSPDYMVF